MKNSIQFILTVLTITFFSISLQARATYQVSKEYGGSGGQKFLLPRNLNVKDLAKITKIRKISIQHNRQLIEKVKITWLTINGETLTQSKGEGSRNGTWSHFYLGKGEFITAVKGRSNRSLFQLTFYTNKGKKYGPYGGRSGLPFSINVPKKAIVIGFSGRAGKWIDKFGLVYKIRNRKSGNPECRNIPTARQRKTQPKKVYIPRFTWLYVESKIGNLNLDVKGGSKRPRTQIWMYRPNTTNAQKWVFEDQGNGYYHIKSVVSGLYLDVQSSSKKSGAFIWQYPRNNTDSQAWKVINAGGGYFYLRSKASGLYLDVRGGSSASGTSVWQHPFNGTNAQKWKWQLAPMDYGNFDSDKAGG